jgi:fructose-bisphosphate aldolase class 1
MVVLEGILLKANMIVAGKECRFQASVPEVAAATLRCLRRHVPAAVPGIVFLSGGQSTRLANGPSERNKPASRSKTLENQLLLRNGCFRIRLSRLAWERG